jgi:3-oxoacyl-[acyl-carrier-protein] synthase II
MVNAGTAALSMRHDLRGPSFQIGSACASGGHAIGTAVRMIQTGDADAVVTGGAEATLTPLARASFTSASAMSPTGTSRPFDARRDGFVMGEGAGVLVLEDEERALARGAQVFGTVRGYATTSDAYHITATLPEGTYAAKAIERALADAELTPGEIDYINAHGTSTELNDAAETTAIKLVFGDRAKDVPISSLKSSTGHLLGAAGAVEAIVTVLAMNARTIPPTLGLEQPDPELDLDYVPLEARSFTPRNGTPKALSNSFGFGGHNVVLCLEGSA